MSDFMAAEWRTAEKRIRRAINARTAIALARIDGNPPGWHFRQLELEDRYGPAREAIRRLSEAIGSFGTAAEAAAEKAADLARAIDVSERQAARSAATQRDAAGDALR